MRRTTVVAVAIMLCSLALGGTAVAGPDGRRQGMRVDPDHELHGQPEPHRYHLGEDPRLKLAPELVGKKNVAGKGHWHIFVNGKYNNFAATTSGKTTPVKKGDYKVNVTLNEQRPLTPFTPVRSKTISVMVD